jgi:phosphoglycolate phosphatase
MVEIGFGLAEGAPQFETVRQRFLHLYREGVCLQTAPFPGIPGLLAALDRSAIPWGVVTNKPGWLTDPLLEALQLTARAAIVVSGDSTAERKPHPGPLLHACRQLDIAPARCAYVGDAARDIEAALRAGMTAIAATFGYIPEDDDPSAWGAHALVTHADEIWQQLGFHGD